MQLCAAIVDRLTFNGSIVETGTHSYRLNYIQQHSPPLSACEGL